MIRPIACAFADISKQIRHKMISHVLEDVLTIRLHESELYPWDANQLKAALQKLLAVGPAFAQGDVYHPLSRLLARCQTLESEASVAAEAARSQLERAKAKRSEQYGGSAAARAEIFAMGKEQNVRLRLKAKQKPRSHHIVIREVLDVGQDAEHHRCAGLRGALHQSA